jgi:hypothetical protein
MNNFTHVSKIILLTTLALLLAHIRLEAGENATDAAELIREMYKTDRRTFLTEEMRLTERESAVFWPLYQSYRAEMEKLGDSLLKLVLEYADVYPDVPEERAEKMLKDYTELERKLVDTRSRYIKRAAKDVSATKALRWAQLENRMDLGLRLQLASTVPLVPSNP